MKYSKFVLLFLFLVFCFFLWEKESKKLITPKEDKKEPLKTLGPNWEDTESEGNTHTRKFYPFAVNYEDQDGKFKKIDTRIVASKESAYTYENTTNINKSYFKKLPQEENFIKLEISGVTLKISFVNFSYFSPKEAEVTGEAITYPEVYPGIDARYTISTSGVLEEFVLTSKDNSFEQWQNNPLTQKIQLENGELQLAEDGSIKIIAKESQEIVGVIPSPIMYEEKNLGDLRSELQFSLEKKEDGYYLSKVLAEKGLEWLAAAQRNFPVVIDASYTGQTKDGYLYKYCSGGTYAACQGSTPYANTSQQALFVGQRWDAGFSEWYIYRTFMSFDTNTIPDGATVNSADLYAKLRSDNSATDFDIKFYSGDWGTLEAADWGAGTTLEGVFRNTSGMSVESWYNKSVQTSSIDKFGETQFRFVSNRDENNTAPTGEEYITFYSANAGSSAPYLVVNFTSPNNPPNTPSNPNPSSGASNLSVFTVLSWTGGDPDAGDTARYDVYFEANDSTPDVRLSNNQSSTSYDSNNSLDNEGDYTRRVALSYGTTYYWQIVARDGFGATTSGPVWSFSTVSAPTQYPFDGQTIDGLLTKSTYASGTCANALSQVLGTNATVETISGTEEVGISGSCYSNNITNPINIYRTYLSFDTASFPDDAYISSAQLQITTYLSRIRSDSPYYNDFAVYSGDNCWGPTLNSNDWDSCGFYNGNIIENAGYSTNLTDVTFTLALDPSSINKTGRTQFRIWRIYPRDDQLILPPQSIDLNYLEMYVADNPTYKPRLVVNSGSPPAINNPPNVPTLVEPPDNAWINYNPTYRADVSDPNSGDTVYAFFDFVSGPPDGNGSSGVTPHQSRYTPSTPDGEYQWRAKGVDNKGAESAYTAYWTVRKDTVWPSSTLDQENGISTDNLIWVNLTESDDRSGVAEGDVDVRVNGGSWQACDQGCGSTTNNFTYTGVNGNTYEFRYRVRDYANNWSNFSTDGSVTIQIPVCDASFPSTQYHACVYDGTNFNTYVGAFDEASISHSWGAGCPAVLGANCDTFSIVWRRNISFSSAYYKFHTRSDDGVRLYVDKNGDGDFNDSGELVIDNWIPHAVTDDYSSWTFLSGTRVMLEYFEDSGSATAIMDWVANNYPSSPTSLLTNNQVNPSGLTGTPYFSAIYNDPDAADLANAYQIQVDDNSNFSSPLWDSGVAGMSNCSQGSRCQNITYAGPALTSGTTYYWQIGYQDDDGFLGSWSTENAFFSMLGSGSLTGVVWVDYDGDCVKDAGEPNYRDGATLYLKQGGVTKYTFSSNSNDSGNNFTLSGVLAGNYDLVADVPPGHRLSTVGSVSVTINDGQTTNVGYLCF